MGLGSAHMQRGNYAEAVEFYEKSLVGKRATLGEFHEDTAQTYMGLGSKCCHVNTKNTVLTLKHNSQ